MINKFTRAILVLLLSATSTLAAENNKKKDGTLLNISISERIEVQDDLLVANLRFEYDADDAKSVQNRINKVMKQAIDLTGKIQDISFSTGQYSVYKNYQNYENNTGNKKPLIWHGVQSLDLKSKSPANILKLTGQLQDLGLVLSGLSYIISHDKMENIKDSMMESAIEKLLQKAQRAAKALGKSEVEVVQLNIDSNNYEPRPQPMSMMMGAEKMASPVAEPGQSQIIMTISASILIKE